MATRPLFRSRLLLAGTLIGGLIEFVALARVRLTSPSGRENHQ